MHLSNPTPLPVRVIPSAQKDDTIVSLLVACATYRVAGGVLSIAPEQRPLVIQPADPTEPHDAYFLKLGASITATGYVYAPGGGAPRAEARLAVADVERAVAAFGARVWRAGPTRGALAASAPLPFDRVEMTWQNAFGGAVTVPTSILEVNGAQGIVPEHEQAYAPNRDGTGFYTRWEEAVDRPLPRLEHPDALVARWDDRPEPACFAPYPVYGGLRVGAVLDGQTVDLDRAGRLFGRAPPRTTFDEIPAGTPIVLEGMRPSGEVLAFRVPPPPIAATVRVGDRTRTLALAVDAVDIDAEAAEARVVWRALFRYVLVAHERRTTTVETTTEFEAMLEGA